MGHRILVCACHLVLRASPIRRGSMQVFAMLSDPEIMKKAMAMAGDTPAPNAKTASLYALLAISPSTPHHIMVCTR